MNINNIRNAYRKFKSYVYYDNFNLHLRYKLAEFEANNINERLNYLLYELNSFFSTGESECIRRWIEQSSYLVIPKAFSSAKKEQNEEVDNTQFISNKRDVGKIEISRVTILYDAPIELFIISTLWTDEANKYLHISSDSYGYVLPKNKNSRFLFEPYFNKYQEWRDKGISAAKQQIERGNNVLFLSLDIKNFFHSTNIDFSQLKAAFPKDNIEINKLTDIIEQICIDHTEKLYNKKDRKPMLPIGLPSSGIIANWLLSDFDKDVKDATAPIYYGRYVDDIFIVISNVEPQAHNVDKWLCSRFFANNNVLVEEGDDLCIKSAMCEGLKIQKKKLRLFYFDANWSLALLNKFQTTIQENSSAFWFLPNEEDLKDSLDDTYDIQYEDTINKFRSISSCKVNKYGASVFLAKRLKLAILSSDSVDSNLESEIFRFFNGDSIISMYGMWEKVFTYFAITHNYPAIKKLHNLIENHSLPKICLNIKEIQYSIVDLEERLNGDLRNHMVKCLMLARTYVKDNFGIHTSNKESNTDDKEINTGASLFKKAFLTRQTYLLLPIVAYTDTYINGYIDVRDMKISDISEGISSFILANNWIIPRHISLHEICTLYIPIILKETSQTPFYKKDKPDKNDRNAFLQKCLNVYNRLNNVGLSKKISSSNHKTYKENYNIKILADSIEIEDDKEYNGILSVGVSNVNTLQTDIEKAIVDKSVLNSSKRKRHIDILNQASKLNIEMLLLPEVFVPLDWLCAYADEAKRKQRAMIFGLEHFSIDNICYNIAITILPFKFHNCKEVLIIPRVKNHYSPSEIIYIKGNRRKIPTLQYSVYHLYQWRGLQFSVYNCFELTDIVHRSIFRSDLDMLLAIEYNKDVNYFSNISESVSRDLHCYYIQANTSNYGDSRVVEPKKTEYMNPVRVKGGDNDVILRYELDINALRQFQSQTYVLQQNNNKFKMTPPDFQHDKVNSRGKKQ